MTPSRLALAATALLAPLLLVAGCAGASSDSRIDAGGSHSASSADSSGDTVREMAPEDASSDKSGPAMSTLQRSAGKTANAVAPMNRAVISRGEVLLHTKDVERVRRSVEQKAASWGGLIAEEESGADEGGRTSSASLTVRVPAERFDAAMRGLAELGKVGHQSRNTEDVTTKVIDTDVRVASQEASIRRIQTLLSRAERIGDVISIESELARRQADLESLKSQQKWLSDQTAMSTIQVEVTRTERPTADDGDGFLAGLTAGWHALGTSLVAVLTITGAVLPFAALAALAGLPLWWLLRGRLRRRVAHTAA